MNVDLSVIKVGNRIKFAEEKQRYTVQARSDNFIICTKPFNPRRTVIYTIIDIAQGLRNRDNLVFGFGYETREDCEQNIAWLESGEMELSHRRPLDINIDEVLA